MRHHLKFEVRGDTAHEIQIAAETIARQFFGLDVEIAPGSVYIDTTADYEAGNWVGRVSVDVRERPPKPEKRHLSANTDFEVVGLTLLEIERRVEGRLGELYGTEPFAYSMRIEPCQDRWSAKVSAWLGSNDMGDF